MTGKSKPTCAGSALRLAVCMWLALVGSAYAQTATGQVNGTVTDPTGAAVPGARIALHNQVTNVEVRALTNASGFFVFVNVSPGPYTLRVEAAGFKVALVSEFPVGVNQTVTHNVQLSLGQVTETVQVTAEAAMLQSSSAELGNVIQEKVVHDLPLNGRNFTQLLILTPGVNPVSVAQGPANTMTFQSEGNTGIPGSTIANASIQGQQNRAKVYFFDGIINTSVRGTSYVVLPDIDMIQEFKVQSHNDKAEYGGVTGGVVNMYSKSGTNDFHGSAFWYVRNDFFDARDPFRDANRKEPLPFRQNQFGANVGGPILRNRTFFHGGYDGWRYRDVANLQARVPTARELDGDFAQSFFGRNIYNPFSTRTDAAGRVVREAFPNNGIPSGLISSQMQGFLKAYAIQPNLTGDPAFNFRQTRSRKSDANNYQVRLDHHFSDRDNVFFRWNEQRVHNFQPVGDRAANSPDFINRNYGGGWLHTFSPGLILEVRGGAATQPSEDAPMEHQLGKEPMKQLGFKDIDRFEGLQVSPTGNPWSFGNLGHRGPAPRGNPNYSLTSNLTWLRGNHNFKMGFQFVRIDRLQINQAQTLNFDEVPTADPQNLASTGDNIASALLGIPFRYNGDLPDVARLEFWTST